MIDPGSNPTGLSKKCLRELAGSAKNFPKRPQIFFRKGFLHSSEQPSVKRAKMLLDLRK